MTLVSGEKVSLVKLAKTYTTQRGVVVNHQTDVKIIKIQLHTSSPQTSFFVGIYFQSVAQ